MSSSHCDSYECDIRVYIYIYIYIYIYFKELKGYKFLIIKLHKYCYHWKRKKEKKRYFPLYGQCISQLYNKK